MILRWLARLWSLFMLLTSGYLWGMRGRPGSRAWRIGTVTCILLLILALLVWLRYR